MIDVPKQLEVLRILLSGTGPYLIVYRASEKEGKGCELTYYVGTTIIQEKGSEIAAKYQTMAARYNDAQIDYISDPGPPNEQGFRLWDIIVTTGAPRRAGYVIVTRLKARDREEVQEYMNKIKHIWKTV